MAGEGADVGDYFVDVDNPQVPIMVEWEAEGIKASKYLIEYATNENFSDALAVEVRGTASAVGLYNLYKATTYYVCISALDAQGDVIKKDYGEFYTTSLGPRVMDIEGVHNVRDLGGYKTSNGKTLVQGIAYRGGHLKPAGVISLTRISIGTRECLRPLEMTTRDFVVFTIL